MVTLYQFLKKSNSIIDLYQNDKMNIYFTQNMLRLPSPTKYVSNRLTDDIIVQINIFSYFFPFLFNKDFID